MSRKKLPIDEIIVDEYTKNKLTCKDICRKYGLSSNTSGSISKILKKYEI